MLLNNLIKLLKAWKTPLPQRLKSCVDKLVQAHPLFSLLIDKSTAVSNHENLVVHVKLLNDVKSEFHFFKKNINVWDGKVKTITTAVNLLMEKRNFDKNRMTGFGSHRACVITGKNNRVTKWMNEWWQSLSDIYSLYCSQTCSMHKPGSQ